MTSLDARPPLTLLSEEEELFRAAVADLATAQVLPRVRAMEEDGKLDSALTAKFVELGLMASRCRSTTVAPAARS